jgi:hypothetical protein
MPVVLNYTTSVPVIKTVAEMQAMLGEYGASAVVVKYGADRNPVGLAFSLPTAGGDRAFTLPVDVDAVYKLLNSRETEQVYRRRHGRPLRPNHRDREHAARVAWRTAQDWLESQLAMVAAHMATLDQLMLPHLHVDAAGTTLYQAYVANDQRALTAGGVS